MDQADDRFQEHRFATTAFADQRQRLAARHVEIDPAQYPLPPELHVQIVNLHERASFLFGGGGLATHRIPFVTISGDPLPLVFGLALQGSVTRTAFYGRAGLITGTKRRAARACSTPGQASLLN